MLKRKKRRKQKKARNKYRYQRPLRPAQSLKPLSAEKTVRNIADFSVCDIECRSWSKTKDPEKLFVTIGHYDGKVFHHFEKLEEFLEYVVLHDHNIVFAHFGGGFDFNFILPKIIECGLERFGNLRWEVQNIIPRGSGLLCFELVVKWGSGGFSRRIKFTDSGAILPVRLEKLTKDFGVAHKKQTFDYESIIKVTPELIEYLEYDCKGLYECIQKFYQWPLIQKAGSALTIAGQSMRILRTFITEEIHSLTGEVDKDVRKGYFGGRVEVFKPLFRRGKGKPLNAYDVSSLYPFVMRQNEMPGNLEGETNEVPDMGMVHCRVHVPDQFVPPLPVKHKNKLIFPRGDFNGWWTTAELNYAKKECGVTIKELHTAYAFESAGFFFRDFIDALWALRLASEKGGTDNALSKLIMNSSYGRTGMRRERENLVFDDYSGNLEEFKEIIVKGKRVMISKKPVTLSSFSHVMMAAHITSLARIEWHKWAARCDFNIYYGDTDSLRTPVELPTGEGLGELKLEGTINNACYLLPKAYAEEFDWHPHSLKHAVTLKGFDKKKSQNWDFEDFRMSLVGDLSLWQAIPQKVARLKSAMIQGKLLALTASTSRAVRTNAIKKKKALKTYYKRRLINLGNGDWTTRALKLKARQ